MHVSVHKEPLHMLENLFVGTQKKYNNLMETKKKQIK